MLMILPVLFAAVDGRYENVNVKLDWWENAVFYLIYPRSFMDSDGDGIGDINGITSRLDYLKDLGVDAAWLSPIYRSPNQDFGFDVSDFYSIQPEYGTMEDFEQLLKKANEINMKIVLELVPNHTSNESEWFIKSSSKDEYYHDWFVWENGHLDGQGRRRPPNNWISVFRKSAWQYSPSRDQYYLHQFGVTQPDLNFRNPVVEEEIKNANSSEYEANKKSILRFKGPTDFRYDKLCSHPSKYNSITDFRDTAFKNILKYWLEKGVAGFSMNSVNYIFEVDKDLYGGIYPDEPLTGKPGLGPDDYDYLDHVYTKDHEENYDLISQFREVFDALTLRDNLTRVLITEAYTGIKNAVRYYGEGMRSDSHIPFNFALIEDLNKESDARDIKYAVDRWLTYKPLRKPANWGIGSLDKSRVASRFRPKLVDAFNMLVLLLPGIAFTYMGEEIGMTNGFVTWTKTMDPLACNTDDPVNFVKVSRDPYRTPFQWSNGKNAGFSNGEKTWLPLADGYQHLNVEKQRSAVRSHYQVYRSLTNLRSRPAFRLGGYQSLALTKNVFAFKRWYNDDAYVVVMNVGKNYQVVNLTAFDLIFGQLEVEVSSVHSSRAYSDDVHANFLDLAADEALVLRMQV